MDTLLKSQPNFRDLGGIDTKSGLKIKTKRLFRSGNLGKIDADDLQRIQSLNVKTIIDLRTPEEIEIIGKGNYPNSITYKNIILSAGNVTKYLIPIFEKGELNLIDSNIMDTIYFDLITQYKSELATIFRTIINTDQGIVYHCSHGKDRTGIISALLLDFFEVDREFIYQDYLLSNALLKQTNDYYIQQIKANFSKQFDRNVSDEEFAPVNSLFYCKKETLQTIFQHIDQESGSVNNYFQKELGLSKEELKLLESKYLE